MKPLSIAALVIFSFSSILAQADQNKVIYGTDDRKDLYEVTDPLQLKLAASTVVLVKNNSITQASSGVMTVNAESFEATMGVCAKEKFSDQPSGGFCSGTLIAPNIILTAGHCITSADDCAATKFVFGYDVLAKGKYPSQVPEADVVGCKSIIYRIQNGTGADFGLIELDRTITNHAPVKLAQRTTANELTKGDALVMIGHPAGLPTKIAAGAQVRDASKPGFLVANTDSYGGNSGSGIFNPTTGELEGVLVRGEQDYVLQGSCYVSKVCAADGCRGEDITKVSSVLPQLPH